MVHDVVGGLIDQPSAAPTPKVAVGITAGVIATIIIGTAQLFGLELDPVYAGALATVAFGASAYLKRDRVV